MAEAIYKLMNSSLKKDILRYIIYIIIFVIIIEELITLTFFVINYNNYADYGLLLNKSCEKKYIEYETMRFHIFQNIDKFIIDNDVYSTKYEFISLLIAIIASLFVSFTYIFIFITTLYQYGVSVEINFSFEYIYKHIFPILGNILSLFLVFYLIISVPLSIYMKYNKDEDVSPFSNNLVNNIIHSILLFAVLLYNIIFFFLPANSNKVFEISMIICIIFFILYIISFYFIMNKLNLYNTTITENKIISIKNEKYTPEEQKYMTFIDKYSKIANMENMENKIDLIDVNSSNINNINTSNMINLTNNTTFFASPCAQALLASTMNSNTQNTITNLISTGQKKQDNYSLIYNIFILIMAILVIYVILYIFQTKRIMKLSEDEVKLIYYYAFVPFLFWFLCQCIININQLYNTDVNIDILYEPMNLYKNNIIDINGIFQDILDEEKNIKNLTSVCQNVANAVHLTVYSSIFGGYNKTFIPELEYFRTCENNRYIAYNDIKEYTLEYYLKITDFYNKTTCTSMNNHIIAVIMKNTIIDHRDFIKDNNKFKNKLKFSIRNILGGVTYNGLNQIQNGEYRFNNTIIRFEASETIIEKNKYNRLIDNVNNVYLEYLQNMFFLTNSVVRSLCSCANLDKDITKDIDLFIKNIEDLILNKTSGGYSLNIKKFYIDQIYDKTKNLIETINIYLSKNLDQIEYLKNAANKNKLTKMIINNYNFYQINSYDKYDKKTLNILKNDKMSQILSKKNITSRSDLEFFNNMLTDTKEMIIKNIELLNNTFDFKYKTDNDFKTKVDSELKSNTEEINNNIIILKSEKENFINLGSTKYDDKDNKDIVNAIFELKKNFIDIIITFIETINDKLNSDMSKNEFNEKYNKIIEKYLEDYKYLEDVINNSQKIGLDEKKSKIFEEDREFYAKSLKHSADTTSIEIYNVLFYYLFILILAYLVE